MSSRRKAMLLLATNNKWLPYSYEYLLNSLVPTTIDNKNVLNQAKIIKLYGNGCVVNQLVALSNIRGTSTNYGITFFNNSDGSLTISGTATQRFDMSIVSNVALQSPHKYLIKTITGSANYLKTWLSGSASGETYDQTMIISPTSSGNMSIYFTFFANQTYNFTVFPQIIYLSHSFGLGYEPTSVNDNRIQAILKHGYITYNTGEYVGTDISEIVSYDTNNNLLATIPFKAQLNGAINSHDTLEITNSAYVFEKNVGIRAYQSDDESLTNVLTDLTNTYYQLATPQTISIPRKHLGIARIRDLTWNYQNGTFRPSNLTNARQPSGYGIIPNAYCCPFMTVSNQTLDSGANLSFSITDSSSSYIIRFRDASITTTTDFINKYGDYYIFYETQDEVDDIVDKIGIEAGGSLSATYNTLALLNLDTKMKCK